MRFKTKPFIGFEIDQTISSGFKFVAKSESNFTIKRLTYIPALPIVKKTLVSWSMSKSFSAAFDA